MSIKLLPFSNSVKMLVMDNFTSWWPFQIHWGLRQLILFHHLLDAVLELVKTLMFFKDNTSSSVFHFAVNRSGAIHYCGICSNIISAPVKITGGGIATQWVLSQVLSFSKRGYEYCRLYCVYHAFNFFKEWHFSMVRSYIGCVLINEPRREMLNQWLKYLCEVETSRFSYCSFLNCNSFPLFFYPAALSPFQLIALIV